MASVRSQKLLAVSIWDRILPEKKVMEWKSYLISNKDHTSVWQLFSICVKGFAVNGVLIRMRALDENWWATDKKIDFKGTWSINWWKRSKGGYKAAILPGSYRSRGDSYWNKHCLDDYSNRAELQFTIRYLTWRKLQRIFQRLGNLTKN